MKPTALRAALLTAMLAVPLATFAQYSQQQGSSGASSAPATEAPATPAAAPQHGLEGARSKHCDTMTGAERDQCLKDEAAKTDSKGPSDGAASGASVPSSTKGAVDTVHAPGTEKKLTEEAD